MVINKEPPQAEQLSLLDWSDNSTVDALLISPDQLFASDDYTLFCSLAEDQKFERKGARIAPGDLAICLSSFGNGPQVHGGVVVIGIANDGTIEGCASLGHNHIIELEQMGHSRCPSGKFKTRRMAVTNSNGERDIIILARVYYVEDQLVELTNGDAYIRFGKGKRQLKDWEKTEVRINKGEISFEQQSCGLPYPEAFKQSDIQQLLTHIRNDRHVSAETSNEQLLEMLHLGKRATSGLIPNNACAVLFAKDPMTAFPGCYIHFLRYEGSKEMSGAEYNVIKDQIVRGTIFDQISGVARILDAQLREFTVLNAKGKFFTVAEYPRDAWYELIVNACVHRAYSVKNAPIFVKMFDDHLLVESPGGFMPQVTPETIYEMHRPRNPFIMQTLREYGEVRCINEGTKRIKKEMTEAGLPAPTFAQADHSHIAVRVILNNDIHNRKNSLDTEAYKILGEAAARLLSDDEKKIINYIIENGSINATEALRIINTTRWHTAKSTLERLHERGVLDYTAGGKTRNPNSKYFLRERHGKEKS